MNEMEHVTHEFQPIYDKNSKVLMLGTMPSPKSREVGFYYGHPRRHYQRQRKRRLHLHCGTILRYGMCWQAVRYMVRTIAVSAIRSRMI